MLSRRDWLKVGSVAVGGSLLGSEGFTAQAATNGAGRAKSVIMLYMMGGVTHIDSFDPKPDAPEEVRGTLATIDTAIPGVQFTEAVPQLARQLDKFALVRSFSHGDNDHLTSQAYVLSGRKVGRPNISTEPNLGSIVSYVQGPLGEMPPYVAVPGITRPGPPPTRLFQGGWLGAAHDPFCVAGLPENPDFTSTKKLYDPPAEIAERLRPPELDLAAGLDLDRLQRRSQLKSTLDEQLRRWEARLALDDPQMRAMDAHYAGAFDLLASSRVREAFDLDAESDALRDAYGRTKIGGRCLLARRLVEAGARFIMVDYGYDHDYGNLWDNHNTVGQNFPPLGEMALRGYHLAGMDRAFAALLVDLEQRGLLESTLVVFLTEFGRTPKINRGGGRDHWGMAGSIFFAGAGVRGGQVIGNTDRQGAYVTTRGYTPGDVAATIYAAVGIDARRRLYDRQNRPHFILPEGEPIAALYSG